MPTAHACLPRAVIFLLATFFLCNFFIFLEPQPGNAQEECDCCAVYESYECNEYGSTEVTTSLTCKDIIDRCPILHNCVGYGKSEDSSGCTATIRIEYTKHMVVRKFKMYPANSLSCSDPPDPWESDNPCIGNGEVIPEWNWTSTVNGTAKASFLNLQCTKPSGGGCLWFCVQQLYPKPYPTDPYKILQCILDSVEDDFEIRGKGQSGSLTCNY